MSGKKSSGDFFFALQARDFEIISIIGFQDQISLEWHQDNNFQSAELRKIGYFKNKL